jgi:hypothetical protein
MDNKLFLSSDDFENKRLNKSFFTNINKGISEQQFRNQYPTNKFDAFEKGMVENWIKETYESTGGEIIKGGFNDTEDVSKVLENMKSQVTLLKGVIVENELGEVKEIFVMPKQEVLSEESTTGSAIEKGKDSDQLEKGKIKDALYYSELKIVFQKTGKEIKEKLVSIKTRETAKLAELQVKLDLLKDKFSYQPTEKYSYEDSDDTLKTFKWDMTYESKTACDNNVIQFNETESGTLTNEECKLHREWNDTVYSYRDVKQEIDAISLLEENLEETKKYELTARQMLNFGF